MSAADPRAGLGPPAAPGPVSVVGGHLPATPRAVAEIRHAVVALAAGHGADDSLCAAVARAVSEAVSNVVSHAYLSPGNHGDVHYAADVEDGLLEVVVADDGEGFRPGRGAGVGLGLSVIASSTAHFDISQRDPRGTEVWMRFLLPR